MIVLGDDEKAAAHAAMTGLWRNAFDAGRQWGIRPVEQDLPEIMALREPHIIQALARVTVSGDARLGVTSGFRYLWWRAFTFGRVWGKRLAAPDDNPEIVEALATHTDEAIRIALAYTPIEVDF